MAKLPDSALLVYSLAYLSHLIAQEPSQVTGDHYHYPHLPVLVEKKYLDWPSSIYPHLKAVNLLLTVFISKTGEYILLV